MDWKNYRTEPPYELYDDAVDYSVDENTIEFSDWWRERDESLPHGSPVWWTARWVARVTAEAIIRAAGDIGAADDLLDQLGQVAAHIAPD